MRRFILPLVAVLASLLVGACAAKPRDQYVQWVARDAWNPGCADKAIVERFKQENLVWKEKGKSVTVDVDATFKLANDCEMKGAKLAAYTSFEFKQSLEMVRCEVSGQDGWALQSTPDRCWTGPKLLTP